jgi:hypothetical protein
MYGLSVFSDGLQFPGNNLPGWALSKKCFGILFWDIEYECMVMSFYGLYDSLPAFTCQMRQKQRKRRERGRFAEKWKIQAEN